MALPAFSLACSLPALIKARGRAAFDVLREPLDAALDAMDADAEVPNCMAGCHVWAACGLSEGAGPCWGLRCWHHRGRRHD